MTRRLFVGDIQGCRDELERLLEALHFDQASDELHPVGDFINRGPDSLGVLRLCKQLNAGGVLGNHDLHFLRVLEGQRKPGRRDTLEPLLSADDCEELATWLRARPILRSFEDVLCVHAGLDPSWEDPVATLAPCDPQRETAELRYAVSVRTCAPDGSRPETDWPEPGLPFRPWFEYWSERTDEQRTVVFGHWARMGRVQLPRVRGLDTGCVWGQELTAWIADEDRFVSVPAARVYSPTSLPPR
jgi:bis(5'-nucleosyl)-tetraphosphatase (symmetrical)